MAATGGHDDPWRISGEDRAKHDSQFFQLKPVNGFVTGEQARGFFLQSGLPNQVLGQIWTIADVNGDGKMDKKEFSIAMHLIKKKLQGYELPRSIPASLKADPSPVIGSFGAQPLSMGMAIPHSGGLGMVKAPGIIPISMTMPGATLQTSTMTTGATGMPLISNGVGSGIPQQQSFISPAMGNAALQQNSPTGSWVIPHANKLKYTQLFNTHDHNKRSFLTGVEARAILVQSGLPQQILAQIWTLSDVDNDGKLTCDEFCIAMHLSDVARTGKPLPSKLPKELFPPGIKAPSVAGFKSPPVAPNISAPGGPPPPQKDQFGDLLGGFGMPIPVQQIPAQSNGDVKAEPEEIKMPVTFEDKRKDNFDRGQAELEKRRQMLQEQMKREAEERQEKERKEQEKREQIRREQEEKRMRELERQLEKQRQIEAEKEEQRRKIMEQRESARRELERQRQMEWERQRKEQLLAEKQRESEQLANLKLQDSNLKNELEALEGKKAEISIKITQVRNGVTDFTSTIESMRTMRDAKFSEMKQLQSESQMLSQKLNSLIQSKDQLNMQVQSTQAAPLSDTHRTVMHSVEQKKTNVLKMKKELEDIEKETEVKLTEIDQFNCDMKKWNDSIRHLQREIPALQAQQKLKQEEHNTLMKEKEMQERELKREEQERQEKLKNELGIRKQKEEDNVQEKDTFKTGNWCDFNSAQAVTSSGQDFWSSSAVQDNWPTSSGQDSWASAFSSSSAVATSNVTWATDTFSSQTASGKSKYRVLYDFESRGDDELNLYTNEEIMVPDDQGDPVEGMEEWLKGEKDGRLGWFPKAYVEKIDILKSADQNLGNAFEPKSTVVDSTNTSSGTLPTSLESSFTAVSPTPGQGQIAPEGLMAKATYPWKARQENHLTFNKDDMITVKEQQDMWWLGELNGKTGWFPKAYVKTVSVTAAVNERDGATPTSAIAIDTHGSATSSPAPDKKDGEYYVAMYSYVSGEATDLNFNEGEMILVSQTTGDWWTGSLNGNTGVFPANYVKKVEIQDGVGMVLDTSVFNAYKNDFSNTNSLNFLSNSLQELKPKSMDDLLSELNLDLSKTGSKSTESSVESPVLCARSADNISKVTSLLKTDMSVTRAQSTTPLTSTREVKPMINALLFADLNTDHTPDTTATANWSGSLNEPNLSTSYLFKIDGGHAENVTEKEENVTSDRGDFISSDLFSKVAPVANQALGDVSISDPFSGNDQVMSIDDPLSKLLLSINTEENCSQDPFGDAFDSFADRNSQIPQKQDKFFTIGQIAANDPCEDDIFSGKMSGCNVVESKTEDAPVSTEEGDSFDGCVDGKNKRSENIFEGNIQSMKNQMFSDGFFGRSRFNEDMKRPDDELDPFAVIKETGIDKSSGLQICASKDVDANDMINDYSNPLTPREVSKFNTRNDLSTEVYNILSSDVRSSTSHTNVEPGQKAVKKPEIAMVIAPYTATGAGQLSLETGNLIQVRQKSPRGWWEGELQARGQKKKIGWFPANYVKLLGPSSARSTPDTTLSSNMTSQQNNRSTTPVSQTSQSSEAAVTITTTSASDEKVKALYAYTAQNDDELTFQKDAVIIVLNKDANDWWQGDINGQVGMFPANYVAPYIPFTRDNRDSNSLIRNLPPEEKNRQNYIQELINTEQTYIDDISIVREVFQNPLLDSKVITEEESQLLFVNLQDLIISGTKLIKSLRVRRKMCGKGKSIHMIGDILCENLPHMTPYVRFCSCQLTAAALLQHKCDTSSEFNEEHKICMLDPRTKSMPLSSFLLKPMQRITKYPLMIKEILKYTPETHADYLNLVDALTRAEELCSQVNEGVREKDNSDRLEWIQKHVHCDSLTEKITFNSVTNSVGPRKLMHSGVLYKVKSNKELMGFLFNDFLLLTTPSKSIGNNISLHMLYSPKSSIHFKIYKQPMLLSDITLRKPTEDESDYCHFQICHTERIYNFKALTETERDLWVKQLELAINQHRKTVQKKLERAHSTSMRTKTVGRLLVIILEGIALQSAHESARRMPSVGRLLVVIIEGFNLKASDQNGKSDPYCEVSMGTQEHRTKVVPGSLNPKWNNNMQFTIKDVNQDVLCISVFDQDMYSPNDFLGRTEIRVKEVLEETKARRGPITKRLSLLEVDSGEVLVKLDLQLYHA